MKWYIVRHAEKEKGDYFNPILRHQDEPISRRGQLQAEHLWDFFSTRPVDAIYISRYVRTGQTVRYMSEKLGLEPVLDDRLNEIDNGQMEGLGAEEIEARFPEVWRGFMERDHDFYFPGGECGEDARQRIETFMLEKQKDNKDIVVVCHEGLIRLWLCHILHIPVFRRWDFRVDFCGIMELEFEPAFQNWNLIRFNHTCM
ncbi:histidine phosphatase family protein [Leptolinea tardivitalis]|uniref:Phosphoglycerate mutase n=1 Tax=Leptolinea tardivitalis TaxID=229920 RepID=A0A0P6WX83_9CHLR|nr:histidine phosphatase family protein [Leptolinea tardivitalis]KPL73331.1 hypothetical protein ADM99_03705 [Leptolinea tardivitalis]GAP21466.1 fructose-2,6-bisphosphatase [Leptolinea tardivitalis]